MTEAASSIDETFQMLQETFNAVPFNNSIGLTLTSATEEEVTVNIEMKDDLIGNGHHRILHGGVICAIMDAVGGAASVLGVINKMGRDNVPDEEYQRLGNLGTVNLHVDFLRPGRGNVFTGTAKILRSGSKVVAATMELTNEEGLLIAVAGGSFVY